MRGASRGAWKRGQPSSPAPRSESSTTSGGEAWRSVELAAVVVQEPEGERGRISSRTCSSFLPGYRGGTRRFFSAALPPGQESELAALLHHPVVVTETSSAAIPVSAGKENLLFEVPAGDKVQALARVLLGRKVPSALVLCARARTRRGWRRLSAHGSFAPLRGLPAR